MDSIITQYFKLGYPYKDIILLLFRKDGIVISRRTLCRRLKYLGLKRNNNSISDEVVSAAIQHEAESNGNYKGYRQMTASLRHTYSIDCTRNQVEKLLGEYNPQAAEGRRGNRLIRRVYNSQGPSDIWHMDGYDKLKPYGIAIHGCIDGYSRKLLWLKALHSNNDPKIIGGLFVQCVTDISHAPRLLRTDCGTENGVAASLQALFHNSPNSHIYGKSTSNQRIEALWSKLRPAMQGWIDYFKSLVVNGTYHQGQTLETFALRNAFLPLINETLHQFFIYHNTHSIRQSSDSAGGIPDILFYESNHCGRVISDNILQTARSKCTMYPTICGDEEMDNYLRHLMRESQLVQPSNKADALELYHLAVDAIE